MSRERFQSETGQTIDDNCLLFGNTSPLFYTVNPRSGISLRQQEQLGAPSILKSFRDLPGCTRLSSSLSNLDNTSFARRAPFSVLPDITQKDNMGKSLQGHHSSSKRFVRERYNPPFKVNAKIRHVYTQEVTTIEGQGQPNHHPSAQRINTCHRQTQTEPQLFPEESKQKPEVEEGKQDENGETNCGDDVSIPSGRKSSASRRNGNKFNGRIEVKKVDASTSPIPSPYFPVSTAAAAADVAANSTSNPFSGCSQMTVYPPLNYVRKLEDLEKITGHIVIQRFFTRTDDAFGTWLEKQLGMTSKSVSVDTSELGNATGLVEEEEAPNESKNDVEKSVFEDTEAVIIEGDNEDEEAANEAQAQNDKSGEVATEVGQEGIISGAINNPSEDDLQEVNSRSAEDISKEALADCAFADPIKCECYLDEIAKADENGLLKEVEEQIIPLSVTPLTAVSPSNETGGEDEIETLISSGNNNEEPSEEQKNGEDIDEVVRCTLEAYLMAPMAFQDDGDDETGEKGSGRQEGENGGSTSPMSAVKSEVDSGRADSIQSHERNAGEGLSEVEGNTSHDSVETVYELPVIASKNNSDLILEEKVENGSRVLQRSLSADSCIGTESSGDAKNQTTNASQSSNDTIEGMDPALAPKEMTDLNIGPPASAPPVSSKLPPIFPASKGISISRRLSSAKSQRSITSCSPRELGRGGNLRRNEKTDAEGEDADGESETESEITDHFILRSSKPQKHHHTDGTDLELEEVEEDEGDEDDRDAFDAMVANHLKYSRGLPTATLRRSKLNRGTQTTKSIEPSTTSGSLSPSSSSNSSFDVEIISKSKRITTTSSSAGGGNNSEQQEVITPSNMTLAWHEGSRRRSYLPSSSSSLNLLNMKFSLGKDFESEVSIRMPANSNNKSSTNVMPSSSMLLPGSGGTGTAGGGRSLMSSTSRTHHHHLYQGNKGLPQTNHAQSIINHASGTSATSTATPPTSASEPTDLQSLWKDVRTKLDVQVDELLATTIQEVNDPDAGGLHVKGNGILPAESTALPSASAGVKLRRNEERIKRSLQRLKRILDD